MRTCRWGPAEARRLFRVVLVGTAAAWVVGAATFAVLLAWSGDSSGEWRSLAPFAVVGSGLLWVWPVVYYPWEFAGWRRVSDAEPGAAPDPAAGRLSQVCSPLSGRCR